MWDKFIREVRQTFTCSYLWEQTLISLGYCTENLGEMPEKQMDCFFLELVTLHAAFQKWVKEAGGIWEDLACRRATPGAVGGGLNVGDESLIVIGVIERNRRAFLGDSGRLCRVSVITEGSWNCSAETKAVRNYFPTFCAFWPGKDFLSDLVSPRFLFF